MKNKLAAPFFGLLLVTGSICHGATVTLTNFVADGTANGVSTSAGTLVTAGSYAAVGYFDTIAAAALTNANMTPATFANLATDFVEFGALTLANWFADGFFQGDVGQAINAGSPFIGRPIYAVIGNGATLAASSEVWIGTTGGNFAQDNPVFNAVASLDEGSGTLAAVFGGFGPEGTDFGATQPFTQFFKTASASAAPIPEPSRAILAGLGLMGLFFRRRR